MSDPHSIYLVRRQLDVSRQPHCRPELEQLEELIKHFELGHPYGPERREELRLRTEYVDCVNGPHAKLDEEFCYRITSIGALVRYTGEGEFSRPRSVDYNFGRLLAAYRARHEDWVPLSRLAQGNLTGPRGFSWWTPLTLLPNLILHQCHSLGLPNDYLAPTSALLRCRTEFLLKNALARVPTPVDGFDGLIFNATAETAHPTTGVAIDLSQNPLGLGAGEIVVRTIPVTEVSLVPIRIDKDLRDRSEVLSFDLYFLGALHDFYSHSLAPPTSV